MPCDNFFKWLDNFDKKSPVYISYNTRKPFDDVQFLAQRKILTDIFAEKAN